MSVVIVQKIFLLICFQPWEPQCFLHDFSHEIHCGDSWGDKLIVATTSGAFVLEGKFIQLYISFKIT